MKLHTTRLIIRSFNEEDIPDYAKIVADPEVARFLGDGSPHSLSQATEYIVDVINREQKNGISRYAVQTKEDSQLIGFCGYKEIDDYTDLGWRYAQRAWGKGYGTEAALAVLDYGINQLELTNILAKSYLENAASLRIIEKLGFPRVERSQSKGQTIICHYQS